MEKTIKINIPDGYDDAKFNETTNEIEFVKKDNKPKNMTLLEEIKNYLDIALRTEYEKGRADAIAEMQKPAWNPEYLIELADKYYDKVLIGECDMDEEIAHHCRLAYLHGLKQMLAAK